MDQAKTAQTKARRINPNLSVKRLIEHKPVLQPAFDGVNGKVHFDRAITLYDPAEHRLLATRFGQDAAVAILGFRSLALWMLGYPETALADTNKALSHAREISQAAALMYALMITNRTLACCGDYAEANALLDELVILADEKGTPNWKAVGTVNRAFHAIQMITSGLTARRAAGTTVWVTSYLPYLSISYAQVGQLENARRCIDEAITTMQTAKEKMWEAEVNRVAGEIALMPPEPDVTKAEGHFERALAVARQQQAKSWELRAAMSLARLWRDQGKVQEARELLAPVYSWFTEGFDTRDLKEAKALLEELGA
jgi:predicted ATPase